MRLTVCHFDSEFGQFVSLRRCRVIHFNPAIDVLSTKLSLVRDLQIGQTQFFFPKEMKMSNPAKIEIKGKRHDDGTFSAAAYLNGEQLQDPDLILDRGNAEELKKE